MNEPERSWPVVMPGTATIRAENDCEVLEIDKPAMAKLLREAPECVNQLSDLLARRKMENEGLIKEAAQAEGAQADAYRATFLRRLRGFFEL